ncbi:unnamed protein product [Lactuca virosa]|uniref:Agenet domain-containing protein n=1 Tax=Lactuca virosa TaxID=75947 RepID=A0AAU9MGM5_9ASTR|nr:unnamed protein product [Lactuca virosa]
MWIIKQLTFTFVHPQSLPNISRSQRYLRFLLHPQRRRLGLRPLLPICCSPSQHKTPVTGCPIARLPPTHHLSTMENLGVQNLKVGQLAEFRTFEKGYRCAWFRCKILDIVLETEMIMLEYCDFPGEGEFTNVQFYRHSEIRALSSIEIKWVKIYEREIKKQLMVRPQYPVMYQKSEMPAVNSVSEVCVTIDGKWKVGDLVDWHKDDCYWSVRVKRVLNHEKVEIELTIPPEGEGGIYEAFCKDLRPDLHWSPRNGWSVPTREGETSCGAQLIFPLHQG